MELGETYANLRAALREGDPLRKRLHLTSEEEGAPSVGSLTLTLQSLPLLKQLDATLRACNARRNVKDVLACEARRKAIAPPPAPAAQEAEAAQQNKLSDDFEQVASWARHSRYRDIENAMNQPDWMLPIDYQDELGNTLLSIAVQNGNKRIAKLCLRRGANVNLPNNTGQTVLHYAYAYGFEDLAEYLKSKGADDRPKNADGLTCYEGLSMEEIEQI